MNDQNQKSDKVSGKRMLIVGPTRGAVHVKSFYFLVRDYFDEVLIVCNEKIDFAEHRVMNFSVKNPLNVFGHIKKMRGFIEEFKPDVIHVHQANTLAYMAIRANNKNIPTVLTCWGSDILVLPQRSMVMKILVKYCLRRATTITVDANYMKDTVFNLVQRNDTVVVNFGIELSDIEVQEKQNIIYSNRLHKSLYRIDLIIRAFSIFVKQNPGWKLIIGATGELTDSLKKMAEEILPEGTFEFIGFVDSKTNREYYLKSRVWVSVPQSDGTSISLLEAMGYGCVPVVSDLPANREWITDQVNGCVMGEELAESFEQAIKLNVEDVQKVNAKIVRERATKQVNQKLFFSVYNEIFFQK